MTRIIGLDRHLEDVYNLQCGLTPDGDEWPEDEYDEDFEYDNQVNLTIELPMRREKA